MVACILGTTRSAFSRRSRHVSLRCSCWAMVRIVSMCRWISPAMRLPLRRTPLHIDEVVRVADGAHALGDLRSLPAEAVVFLTRGFHVLLHLLQARCHLWRAARTALC